jgi:hypothetical protein
MFAALLWLGFTLEFEFSTILFIFAPLEVGIQSKKTLMLLASVSDRQSADPKLHMTVVWALLRPRDSLNGLTCYELHSVVCGVKQCSCSVRMTP